MVQATGVGLVVENKVRRGPLLGNSGSWCFSDLFFLPVHQVGNFPSGNSGPIQHLPTPPSGQIRMALQPCFNGKAAFSPREMPVHVSLCVPHVMAQRGSAALACRTSLRKSKHQCRSRDSQSHHHSHTTLHMTCHPLVAFPEPKDAESPLSNRVAVYICCLKADL